MNVIKVAGRSVLATLFMALCTLMALTLVLLGLSIKRDISSDNTRNTRVQEYEDIIRYWNSSAGDRFQRIGSLRADLKLSFNGSEQTIDNHTLELTHDVPEQLRDTEAPDHFEFVGYSSKLPLDISIPWTVITAQLEVSGPNVKFSFPFNLTKEEKVGAVGWKVCHFQKRGAYLRDSSCVVYSLLNQMCFTLDWIDTVGKWELTTTGSCPPRSDSLLYDLVRTPRNTPPNGLNATSLHILIRSSDDPHLRAFSMTDGTSVFGITQNERLASAWLCLIFGSFSALIALSLVICFLKQWAYYSPTGYSRLPSDTETIDDTVQYATSTYPKEIEMRRMR